MKQEKIIVWTDILATQMNHWTFFAIMAALSILSGVRTLPLGLWLLGGFLPVLFFFIRRYTNGFPVMAGSHILCLILLFYIPLPNLALKASLCIYGIGLVIYSFCVRLRTGERLDEAIAPPVAIGIVALSLFLLHYEGYTEWDIYYMGMIAVYFICYYIRYYFQHYLYFLSVNAGSAGHIPRKEIFSSGAKLSALYTLLGVGALMLVSDIRWLAWIFGLCKQGILWLREHGVFAWIASLFEDTYEPIVQTADTIRMNPALAMEPGEPGLLWVVLEKALWAMMPILYSLLFCLGIYRFVKMLRERFRRKRQGMEEPSAGDGQDIREKYEIKKEKETQRDFFAFLNPTERIRRIYKQRIWAKRTSLPAKEDAHSLSTYTARECGSLLREEQLVQIYEKARYSGVACTKEDVRRAIGKK